MKIHFKKFLVSGLVIFLFIFYSFYDRVAGSTAGRIIPGEPASSLTGGKISYKDGEYLGSVADAYYGQVQVKAIILGGKITDVQFLDYPRDQQTSVLINSQAMPILKSEAVKIQGALVDTVSGATETSGAFIQSLASALNQALAPGQVLPQPQPRIQGPRGQDHEDD